MHFLKRSKALVRIIFLPLALLLFSNLSQSQTLSSTNLPILKVNTSGATIVDEPKINANLEIIYNGPGMMNNIDDEPNEFDGKIGIELRGQTSLQLFPKKGFGFEFRDEADDDLNVAFLNFPEESDFVLHGPYSDKTLIRNAMAYYLAGSIMQYAPRIRMVELVLNDQYWGVYLLTEKIKRDKERVDVNKLKEDEIAGDNLTGGYIIKLDKLSEGDRSWATQYPPFPGADQRPLYVYHYPKAEDIAEIQAQYIKDLFDSFEDVMAGNDYEDENIGYPSIIDVETFVNFFFVNEIGRNVDGYRLSTFFYKDKDSNGGKIKAGPVWDFNLAFGNANYCEGGNTAGWAYNFSDYCPEDFFAMPFWWPKLLSSDSFQAVTKERWQELRQGPLSTETILYIYDSLATEVADAAIRNFQRWPVLDIHIWPNAQVAGSIAAELQWTRTWIIDRLTWMDNQINSFVSDVFDVEFVSDFHIYPQPTSAEISLEFVPLKSGPAIMTIYNSLGQSLESLEMQLSRNTAFSTTLRPNFPHGYFIYQITQNGQLIKSGKIIKH